MRYQVQRGRVEVKARSSLHDTTTVWAKLSGSIDFDPDARDGAQAEISVDMRSFDAGDRFKNWKIKSDLDPEGHHTATFRLTRFDQIAEPTAGNFEATAAGQLAWHGRSPDIKVKGKGKIDRRAIDAQASFELDVRTLGVAPPRFLMFKVEDVVLVQVTLFAVAVP